MSIIKKVIDSNIATRTLKDRLRLASSFNYDKNTYRTASKRHDSNDYMAIMVSHSLEKGMSFNNPRPFGVEKVKELMKLIPGIREENKAAIEISINTLREYVNFYERQKWTDRQEYLEVKTFLTGYKNIPYHEAGVKMVSRNEIVKGSSVDYGRFLLSRHSIRSFSKEPLKMSDIRKAVDIAKLTPTACNRQMVRVVFCQSKKAKDAVVSTIKANLVGFDVETVNPMVVTFDAAAFYGLKERNQGWLNAGLFAMNFVNALHSIGIATCICEFQQDIASEKRLKKCLSIPDNERIAVTIMAGYYPEKNKVYASHRIPADEILRTV